MGGPDTNSVCQFALLTYMRSRITTWFASDMANADAYDWRVDSYVVLVRVHSSPSRQ